jgi:hypothetical protein
MMPWSSKSAESLWFPYAGFLNRENLETRAKVRLAIEDTRERRLTHNLTDT